MRLLATIGGNEQFCVNTYLSLKKKIERKASLKSPFPTQNKEASKNMIPFPYPIFALVDVGNTKEARIIFKIKMILFHL